MLSGNLCKLCVRCSTCGNSQLRAVYCLRGLLEACVLLAVLSDILDGQSFMHGYSWFALR